MERELWKILYALARRLAPPRWWEMVVIRDWEIVSVYFWSVIHDRPVSWACKPGNWDADLLAELGRLPSQPTMSRRLKTTEVQRLLHEMEQQTATAEHAGLLSFVDGKPLLVGSHSKDPDAKWGHVRRGYAKGYKLHAVYSQGPTPLAWEIAPLNEAEPEVAARLVPAVRAGGGYLLGDSAFDSNPLHEVTSAHGWQLLAQRKRPEAGLGHRPHTASRLRSIHLLTTDFGKELYQRRENVERHFGWLTNHGGGLAPLPNWVRRIHRVRLWIQAKLIVHAAYVHYTKPSPQLAVA